MGWLWSSSSEPDEQPDKAPSSSPPNNVPSPTAEVSPSSAPAPAPRKPIMTREEQADAELLELLSTFASKESSPSSSTSFTPTPSSSPSSSSSTTTTITAPPPQSSVPEPKNIAPESLYPTTMSCRQAFDHAFACQGLGGQWVNVYRYGELRMCSDQWSDFWFCMRTKSNYSDNERAKLISDRYRAKAVKYKTGPSSEDVWDVRTEPVRGAFDADFLAMERVLGGLDR
ncbi:hypothetical protein AJ80_08187 [Polytolypa hystricis UAMH7299]|uniref:Early meiotic induction protein 1 n=1 Tax=Polytolypa hystricis (strain UAMH7299) TaxID=1447883 RepID=A0A2B7XC85_POLH7|nr:hypothetical protein AJ80_08187 [Polytolypa hystricis UAMH7299]